MAKRNQQNEQEYINDTESEEQPSEKAKRRKESKDPQEAEDSAADSSQTTDGFNPPSIKAPAKTPTEADIIREQDRWRRIREIIQREFDREISMKEQQLKKIDDNLREAMRLMDHLRYELVSEYYKKHEVALTNTEVKALRGEHSLFNSANEPEGPQKPLHPSLKKILGKKPKNVNLQEIMRPCPQRAAAQSARQTMLLRTKEIKRKQHNRLEEIIRRQGIVIDHSKETDVEGPEALERIALKAGLAIKQEPGMAGKEKNLRSPAKGISPKKALNSCHMTNNMAKHYVVVGNTSKYIGGNEDAAKNASGQALTHKWLVYVQAKEANVRLEKFVKKVRFFLHPSYRPNDIVDVYTPPFQLAQRGWGEFPLRVQLFFHDHFHQKPVQLMHKLVLDKTLSGLQTLGAETVLEIWLKSEHLQQKQIRKDQQPTSTNTERPSPRKSEPKGKGKRLISFNETKPELGDNFFEFLDKIEETRTSICADIETIQPTVVVTEPLASLTTSPIKKEFLRGAPATTSTVGSPRKTISFDQSRSNTAIATAPAVFHLDVTKRSSPPQADNNFLVPRAKTKLPVAAAEPKNVLQEKPVEIKNENGLTKFVKEVGVSTATAMAPPATPLRSQSSSASVMNPTRLSKKVFQKEGKLYIIDPVQNKLKQQQKSQVSLLKPQVSLLKKRQTQAPSCNQQQPQYSRQYILDSIAHDHDYIAHPKTLTSSTSVTTSSKQPCQMKEEQDPFELKSYGFTDDLSSLLMQRSIRGSKEKVRGIAYALDLRRKRLEHELMRCPFGDMNTAVVYMLRRLPLITPKNTLADAFPFTCNSEDKFHDLPALKQRSMEWMRAKCIEKILKRNEHLKMLNDSGKDSYWSTKEIVMFARYHLFTPQIKPLTLGKGANEASDRNKGEAFARNENFSDIVRHELESGLEEMQYETLTSQQHIVKWIEDKWELLKEHERLENDMEIVNVHSLELNQKEKRNQQKDLPITAYTYSHPTTYLPPLLRLQPAIELVKDVCKDRGLDLQPEEELMPGVLHPMAQTVMAQSLCTFVDKLLRLSVAHKIERKEQGPAEPDKKRSSPLTAAFTPPFTLTPHDIAKVIGQSKEFDFLSNNHLGIMKLFTNEQQVQAKEEQL